ncbi:MULTISPECIES: helix-turn-helix domain-containing protein [Emticicia]|uniref:helix-turn-helix domain-containing protein n=1 Tax=Emticicia TaxID=312278 RepID=UPI00209F9F0C|nr:MULTISPECIES: AraC family transcriptional regulator [Emticicia]UTA68708.1 AraC family transcriptional regulator [Emticicia sp. 21SJ11W-3]
MLNSYPKAYLYRRIVQAKLFIDRHYHEPIDLASIADEAFFSKFHFIRQFKLTYTKTPHQYLTHVRLDKAKGLLKTKVSVSEVCYSVGFESVTSFTGLFKKYVGKAPSVYQQEQLKRQSAINSTPLHYIPGCFAQAKEWKQKSNFEEVSF